MNTSQKRVSIFLPDLVVGGAERSMLKLAGGIAGRGYAVDLVLSRAEGPFLAEVPKSVRLLDLKARRVLTSLPALIHYLRRATCSTAFCLAREHYWTLGTTSGPRLNPFGC
jgi:hypothetical protein